MTRICLLIIILLLICLKKSVSRSLLECPRYIILLWFKGKWTKTCGLSVKGLCKYPKDFLKNRLKQVTPSPKNTENDIPWWYFVIVLCIQNFRKFRRKCCRCPKGLRVGSHEPYVLTLSRWEETSNFTLTSKVVWQVRRNRCY